MLKTIKSSLAELKNPPAAQIPFLDGLRSIAVLLVINGHASVEFVKQHGANFYSRIPVVLNGWIGVDLFFILSGFFIGGQLWSELKRTGKVDVWQFVVRRGLRIWPYYYFVFFTWLVVLGFHGASQHHFGWTDFVFLSNYIHSGIVNGGWSLCTEEQFYLIAPLGLLLLSRKIKSLVTYRWLLVGGLFIVPLFRLIYTIQHGAHPGDLVPYKAFHTHCDGLILGLIISNLWISKGKKAGAKTWTPVFLVLGALAAFPILRKLQHEVLIYSALTLVFGAVAWYGLHRETRIFNSKLFYWVSRLSFGMYLNHFLLVEWVAGPLSKLLHVPANALGNVMVFVLLSTCSALVATVTFCAIEFPFLELRGRWLERKKQLAKVAAAAQPAAQIAVPVGVGH